MHFDLAHAAVSAVLIFATIAILRVLGIVRRGDRWNWRLLVAIFIVMFVFNLIWPY